MQIGKIGDNNRFYSYNEVFHPTYGKHDQNNMVKYLHDIWKHEGKIHFIYQNIIYELYLYNKSYQFIPLTIDNGKFLI